jgi:hypothetical protein
MSEHQTPTPPADEKPKTGLKRAQYVGLVALAAAVVLTVILILRLPASLFQKAWAIVGLCVAGAAVATTYATAARNRGKERKLIPAMVVFNIVCFIIGGLVVVSFYCYGDAACWATAMMWSFGCLALGGIAGFLFAVPRSRSRGRTESGPASPAATGGGTAAPANQAAAVLQQPQPQGPAVQGAPAPAPAAPATPPAAVQPSEQQGDETPIEQIADWLTKIIVGLGLANIKDMPGLMGRWAWYVAGGIAVQGPAAQSFAMALIIYFVILGFMGCYVLTQIFLLSFINQMRPGGQA